MNDREKMSQKVEQSERRVGEKVEREEERSNEGTPRKKTNIDVKMQHEQNRDEPTPIQYGREYQGTQNNDEKKNQTGGKAPRKSLATKAPPPMQKVDQPRKPHAEKVPGYKHVENDDNDDDDEEEDQPQRHLATKAPRPLEEEEEEEKEDPKKELHALDKKENGVGNRERKSTKQTARMARPLSPLETPNLILPYRDLEDDFEVEIEETPKKSPRVDSNEQSDLQIRKVLHSRHNSLDLADLDSIPPPPTENDVITWENIEELANEDTQFLTEWIELNEPFLMRNDFKSLKEARNLHKYYEKLKSTYQRGIELAKRIQKGKIEVTDKVESLKKKVLDAANKL